MTDVIAGYEKQIYLGKGANASVFLAKCQTTDIQVSIKSFKYDIDDEDNNTIMWVLHEVAVLSMLCHPNIIKMLKFEVEPTKLHIIYGFCDHTLHGAIKNNIDYDVMDVMRQLVNGLAYCHGKGIIHTDLKPRNIFINNDGTVKIGDFGDAIYNDKDITTRQTVVTTLWFRAPEVLMGMKDYDYAIDMWAVGCIYYELVCKESLFMGEGETDQLFQIFRVLGTVEPSIWPEVVELPYYKSTFPKWTAGKVLSQDGIDAVLILSLLSYNPQLRMTALDAVDYIGTTEDTEDTEDNE